MTRLTPRSNMGRLLGASALAAGLVLAGSPALAQTAPAAPPSTSAMENLIRLLVQNKVISQQAADALTQQAETEAAQARAATPGQAQAPSQMAALPPPAPGVVRVPYIPQVVRDQLKAEVRAEVLDEVKEKHWAVPNAVPDWVNRIEWSGDLRVRDQENLYGDKNIGSGGQDGLIDYANLNANGPIDINPATNLGGIPFMNTTNDRNLAQIRARLQMLAHVDDAVDVGVRIATGQTNSPVSTIQTLGGGLSNKNVWLDRAYVNIHPFEWGSLTLGRAPNPFLSTDLVFDDDLNFDGFSARLGWHDNEDGFGLRTVLGAFPLEYSSDNFPTNDPSKSNSRTKWLMAAQVQADWRSDDLKANLGVAYYDFHHIRGELSQPCLLTAGNKQCSSDLSRPAFMQKGNTLFLIRDILPDPSNPLQFAQPQYVGLSMDYKLLDITGTLDWRAFGPYHLQLTADYVRNLAYSKKDVCRYAPLGLPVTNVLAGADDLGVDVWFDPCDAPPPPTPPETSISDAKFESGPNAWMIKATFGYPTTTERGQWNLTAGYKYIQPDAVVDAFNDADFHLGGTNAQGYFISGSLGLFKNTWLTARWLSANQIYGPPLQIDVGQLDLNIAF